MNYEDICLAPFPKIDFEIMFSRSFFSYFFQNILKLELAAHHRDMANMLIDDSNKQVFMQAARGHGKSELVSVAFTLWLLLTKGSDRPQPYQICLISATETQMRKLMQRIKNYIESVPMISSYLKPRNIHEAKWNESEMVTANNVHLIGKPLGSSIRGLHVDMCILDDVLSDEMADIEGAKDIFNAVVSPIVRTKKGRMIVVGTPMSFDDLFSELFDPEKYPSALTAMYPARLPNGNPLWKERFTKEELDLVEKNMGPIKWAREYMLKPIGAGAMLFDEKLVDACIEKDILPNKQEDTDYYLGCDVALSGAKSADYSVFTIVEKTPKEPLRIVEIWREQGIPMNEQIEVIKNLHQRYNFARILIEKIGLSYGMVEDLQKDDVTRAVTEEFITNQKNKEDILSRLHVLMKNGQLRIPNDQALETELKTFGVKKKKDGHQTYETLGKHDDMVMSLAMACYVADQYQSPYDFVII